MTLPAGRSSSTAHCTVTADLEAEFSGDVIAEGFPALGGKFPDDVIACLTTLGRDRLCNGTSVFIERVSPDDVITKGFLTTTLDRGFPEDVITD